VGVFIVVIYVILFLVFMVVVWVESRFWVVVICVVSLFIVGMDDVVWLVLGLFGCLL